MITRQPAHREIADLLFDEDRRCAEAARVEAAAVPEEPGFAAPLTEGPSAPSLLAEIPMRATDQAVWLYVPKHHPERFVPLFEVSDEAEDPLPSERWFRRGSVALAFIVGIVVGGILGSLVLDMLATGAEAAETARAMNGGAW